MPATSSRQQTCVMYNMFKLFPTTGGQHTKARDIHSKKGQWSCVPQWQPSQELTLEGWQVADGSQSKEQVEKVVYLLTQSPEFLWLDEVVVLQKEAAEMSVMQLAPDMVTVNSHVGSLSLGALMIVALVGMARVAMVLQVSPLLLLTEKLVLLLE